MALRGTNQGFGRPYNRRIVLETIRRNGPITRADIAKMVGLTLQTVSTITSELLDQGFVVLRRGAPKGRGFPAPCLEINPDGGHAVGVIVTPRGLQVALVNLAGEIVARDRLDAPYIRPDDAFPEIARLVDGLRGADLGRSLGVGLAMPGPFDVEPMSFIGPTTMEGWKGVPILKRLEDALGLPAFMEVEHTAAAHGEQRYGLGQRLDSFYYLYFGVGLGGCMIQKGEALRGSWGNAGEIGHIPIVPDGEPCPCGNRGCLERYVSLEAFERHGRKTDPSVWASHVAPLLRSAIVTIENLYDPQTIVMGGIAPEGLLKALADVVDPLPNSVAARPGRGWPRVMLSASGPDAVLRGAAALAVSGALSPRIGLQFPPAAARVEPERLSVPKRAGSIGR